MREGREEAGALPAGGSAFGRRAGRSMVSGARCRADPRPPAIEHPCHQGVTRKLMVKPRAQASSVDCGWAVLREGFGWFVTEKTNFKPIIINVLKQTCKIPEENA